MKTVGIIAEYNPFHNGHAYQLTKAKELSGADYCVVVMSGDFTQRGTPAIIDKYVRTKMALACGADLVIELPVCFATGSAEYFAYGAVSLLDALGVNALCFGSECGEVDILQKAAAILAKEPAAYKEYLQKHLKSGTSFPAARALAVAEYCGRDAAKLSAVLQSPNNILGVEYLKALYRRKSSMEVYTVKRQGAGYLDTTLTENCFSSALAIRTHLAAQNSVDRLADSMPKEALHIMTDYLERTPTVVMDDFSSMMYYKLLSLANDDFVRFLDVSEALSDKIIKSLFDFTTISAFCEDHLKSKDITLTRIMRSLLHILLDIKKTDMAEFMSGDGAFYARILGFRKSSEALFGAFSDAQIPIVSKLADAEAIISPTAAKMLKQDLFAAHLYEGILAQKNGGSINNEYRRRIVVL